MIPVIREWRYKTCPLKRKLKKVNIRKALSLCILLCMSLSCFAKGQGNQPFLKTRVVRDKVTEGENIMYEVILYSPSASVAGIEPVSSPGFEGLDVRHSAPDNKLVKVEVDGNDYYSAVIDRYFLRFPNKGKYLLTGANYRLGLNRQTEYFDPFWGPSLSSNVEVIGLKAPDVSVKVSGLPDRGKTQDFSGAVGDFEISAMIPEGSLRSGEDMFMMVTVSGTGNLENISLPEIREALPEGLQFKSMTDNLSHYVKDGELGSELEIECILTPKKEGSFVIDNLKFTFFNSRSGRYETIKAPRLEFEVAEGSTGKRRPPVIMEI